MLKIGISSDFFNPYDLRLYYTTQASLIFCMTLSGGLACFSDKPKQVFFLITGNCLFHLILDSIQIKWANGVHFFIPFSWATSHFDTMWPEHTFTLLLTVFGLFFLIWVWNSIICGAAKLKLHSRSTTAAGLLLVTLYLLGPLPFLTTLEESNFYFINTLRKLESRPGKYIEFDRAHYDKESNELRTFSRERLTIVGQQPQSSGRVSLKGHFVTAAIIHVDSFHLHRDFRDQASVLGLFMACTLLFQSLILPCLQFLIKKKDHSNE